MRDQYAWKSGWSPSDLDPQDAGEELARIRQERGKITAEIVVEESRPQDAPLHDTIFHVGAKKAAELYYEERARSIIRAVVLVREDPDEYPVRAFQFVLKDDEGSYVPSEEIALDDELKEQIRKNLIRKLSQLRRELEGWEDFAGIAHEIDQALAA